MAFVFVPVNNRYHIPDIAVRVVSMKAVLLVLFGISDRPGNTAGTACLVPRRQNRRLVQAIPIYQFIFQIFP